jgi:hypothetical protein
MNCQRLMITSPETALVARVVPGAEEVVAGVGQDLAHVHQPMALHIHREGQHIHCCILSSKNINNGHLLLCH